MREIRRVENLIDRKAKGVQFKDKELRATVEELKTIANSAVTKAEAAETTANGAAATVESAMSTMSGYVTSAAGSATSAAGSATEASGYATNASQYASNASTSAAAAAESATSAGSSAGLAMDAASSAATSADAAASSASTAGAAATSAAGSESSASGSAADAASAALAAAGSSASASGYATEAQSYAKGGTSSRTGEDSDNAYYYKGLAATAAGNAANSATAAAGSASDAEAWAAGTREGTNVESTDDAYHNNAKYWSEQVSASTAQISENARELGAVVSLESEIQLDDLTWETYHYFNSSGKYVITNSQYSASADFVDVSFGEYSVVVGSGITLYVAYYSDSNESSFLSKANINNSAESGYSASLDISTEAKFVRFQIQTIDLTKTESIYLVRKGDIYGLPGEIEGKADRAISWDAVTETSASQYAMKSDGTNHTSGYKKVYSVSGTPKIKVTGYRYGSSMPLFLGLLNDTIVCYYIQCPTGANSDIVVNVPYTVDTIVVNGNSADGMSLSVMTESEYLTKYQGTQYAGDYLKVGADGNITPYDVPYENSLHGFSLKDYFSKLTDAYYDDFYRIPDENEDVHFIDESHPYTRIDEYGGQNEPDPTIETGIGCYTVDLSHKYIMAKEFDKFPFAVAIGRYEKANPLDSDNPTIGYIQMAFYATGTAVSDGKHFTINTLGNGALNYGGTVYGRLSPASAYYLFVVERDHITAFDDTGFSIIVPLAYEDGLPMNYGMYFGSTAGRTYGYATLIQFNIQDMAELNMNTLINRQSTFVTTVRQYKDGNDAPVVQWPGAPYAYVLTDADNDPRMSHTNNPVIKFHDAWDSYTYRTEFRTNVDTKDLTRFGKLQRHHTSIDYYIPSSENELETPTSSGYATTIFQIHDSDYYLDGWTDPPPVKIDYNEEGKLTVQINSLPDGTEPVDSTDCTRTTYELCDAPMDEWFNIEVEARIAWLPGLMPYVRICVNGVEKLNVNIPVGYNIIPAGGYTHIQTGLYTPLWKSRTYEHMSRTMYIANVKYEQ